MEHPKTLLEIIGLLKSRVSYFQGNLKYDSYFLFEYQAGRKIMNIATGADLADSDFIAIQKIYNKTARIGQDNSIGWYDFGVFLHFFFSIYGKKDELDFGSRLR